MVALIGVLLLLGAAPAVAQDAGEAVRRDSPFDGNAATTERIGAESVRAQAIAISAARFADGGAVHVVVSRDDVFADSLAGTALLRDGPLLLVAPNGVPSETLAELTRVLPQGGRVYLLGGANPTAAWADSVAVGGWTAWTRSPIVLTPSAGVHPAVAVLVQTMAPSRTVLLGGTAALSPAVEQAMPNPQRLAGANRADTAVVIARDLWPGEAQRYAVINGYDPDGWAHGLPAAGLSADAQAPLLVAQAGSVPQETLRVVSPACGAAAPVDVLVLGGEAQLNAHLVPQLDGSDPSACAAAPACHQSYPDFCVAPPPPDLNCGDIADTNFTVLPPDPHDFDGNQDGVGCES